MSETSPAVTAWPKLDLPYGIGDDTRIAPYILVRSAVFSAQDYCGNAERLRISDPMAIPSTKPYRIKQIAGERLSQSDADVFFLLLSILYRHGTPTGKTVLQIKRSKVLSELGRRRGGRTDLLLDESLQRLTNASFVHDAENKDGTRREQTELKLLASCKPTSTTHNPFDYEIAIDDSVAPILASNEWVLLPGEQCRRLSGWPLAARLYAFYQSNANPYPMFSSTIKGLMGRDSMQESKWENALRVALAQVQSVAAWAKCELVEGGPLDGKVQVLRGNKTKRYKGKSTSTAHAETAILPNP